MIVVQILYDVFFLIEKPLKAVADLVEVIKGHEAMHAGKEAHFDEQGKQSLAFYKCDIKSPTRGKIVEKNMQDLNGKQILCTIPSSVFLGYLWSFSKVITTRHTTTKPFWETKLSNLPV